MLNAIIDKNGKEIKEGDILKSGVTGFLYEVEKQDNGELVCDAGIFVLHKRVWPLSEVVGNMKDNPELINSL